MTDPTQAPRKGRHTAVALACALLAGFATPQAAGGGVFDWSELPPLPDPVGFAGAFVGVSGDALLVAGGANFPGGRPWDGHAKVWHQDVFVLPEPDGTWRRLGARLPRPAAYGVSLSWEDAVVCIGGGDAERHHADVWLARWTGADVTIEELPSLPGPVAFACGVLVGDIACVFGGIAEPDSTGCLAAGWALDLARAPAQRAWVELPPCPGPPRHLAVAGTLGGAAYVFGGVALRADATGRPQRIAPYLRDAWRLRLPAAGAAGGAWERLSDLPQPVAAAPSPAVALGSERLALLGGDDGALLGQDLRDAHPGFAGRVLLYDATLDRWWTGGRMPQSDPARAAANPVETLWPVVTTGTATWRGRAVVPSGEARPGVRTNRVLTAVPHAEQTAFGAVDYGVLVLYLGAVVLVGVAFSRRERSTHDFFLGGQRVPWWAAGTSVFATQLSAITFLALPAKSYATDWTYFLQNLGIVAITPLVVAAYIPVFRRSGVTSIYDWLGRRFDGRLRAFGMFSFVSYQLARMGIVVFLPALALSAVTGMDVQACILVMGVLSIVYTVLGGIEAVIWTDVLQVAVLLGGAIGALAVMLVQSDGGAAGAWELALARDKLRLADLSWDWTTPALGVILLGGVFNNLVPYTSDQAVVQRYLTTADERLARRAAWAGALLSVPASLAFFAIGTGLFAFYASHPERLDPTAPPDQIFATFIVRELPVGARGVVIAGVFAAAMSSLDSSMNAIAAVVTPARDASGGLTRARLVTVVVGVVGTLVALLLSMFEVRSLLDRFLEYLGLLGGTLGGLFALGVLTPRVDARAALLGVAASVGALVWVRTATDLSPLLYATIGMSSCFAIGVLASSVLGGGGRARHA